MSISTLVLAAAIAPAPIIIDAPAAAAEAAAGVEAYRVLIASSRRPEPQMIAFERRPGQAPKVVVYSRNGNMEAPASVSTWRAVQTASQFADRQLAPVPPDRTSVVICADGSTLTVEIINGPARHRPTEAVRTAVQTTCDGGLTHTFGLELARLAIEQLPACAALTDKGHGDHTTRLELCRTLSGDKIAAAELANQIGDRLTWRADKPEDWKLWMGVYAPSELNWSGQIIKDQRGPESPIAKFLASQEETWIQHLFARRFEGIDARTVKVTGAFTRHKSSNDPAKEVDEQADYEQVWALDPNDREWKLATWRVESFGPRPNQ